MDPMGNIMRVNITPKDIQRPPDFLVSCVFVLVEVQKYLLGRYLDV